MQIRRTFASEVEGPGGQLIRIGQGLPHVEWVYVELQAYKNETERKAIFSFIERSKTASKQL